MPYELQLDSFQGPLEVLYQLVKKNRIEISEISLASISEQYLEYMERLKDFNLELASEFMVIAAELIQLKVRALLPGEEKGEGQEEISSNLVERLQEYHYFKRVSAILQEYEEKGNSCFPRAVDLNLLVGEEIEINLDLELRDLQEAFIDAMTAYYNIDPEEEELEEKKWEQLKVENIKVEDKIDYIISKLEGNSFSLTFSDLVEDKDNRLEVVVTLLSVLELCKLARIRIKQDRVFSNIKIN